MANIEHSIRGPFYFGEEPTYVDFSLLYTFDWTIDDTWLNALVARAKLSSRDVYAPFPKIRAVLSTLRARPWYDPEYDAKRTYPLNVDFERVDPATVEAYE